MEGGSKDGPRAEVKSSPLVDSGLVDRPELAWFVVSLADGDSFRREERGPLVGVVGRCGDGRGVGGVGEVGTVVVVLCVKLSWEGGGGGWISSVMRNVTL